MPSHCQHKCSLCQGGALFRKGLAAETCHCDLASRELTESRLRAKMKYALTDML